MIPYYTVLFFAIVSAGYRFPFWRKKIFPELKSASVYFRPKADIRE